MIPGRIKDGTRVLGASQGYISLPIRDELLELNFNEGVKVCPAMTSAWIPNPAEMKRIAEGASILLTVMGIMHPPILLAVGEIPDAAGGAGEEPKPPT